MNTSFSITAIAAVCVVTLTIGALGFRLSRTTSDFYVASRMVTPTWNAAAIGGAILPLYATFSPDRDILLKREQRPPIVA